MARFTADITYTAEATMKLAKTQQKVFNGTERAMCFLASLLFIALAFYVGTDKPYGILILVMGCFALTNIDAPARNRAKKTIAALKGYEPKMKYSFETDAFTCTTVNEENRFPYTSLIRMSEDDRFFYLFPDRASAFLIEKASVTPGDAEKLKAFLEKKAGICFIRSISLLKNGPITIVKNLLFNRKHTRRKAED